MYGIRQTPSRVVFDTSPAFSALRSNATVCTPESAALESMNDSVHVHSRQPESERETDRETERGREKGN